MNIRRATEADEAVLHELWEQFEAETPPPPGEEETWEEAWPDVLRHIREGISLLAENDGRPVGYLWVRAPEKGRAHVTDAYVRPDARRRGVTRRLLAEAVAELRGRGADWLSLEVQTSNELGRRTWEAFGFEEIEKVMLAQLDALDGRLAGRAGGPAFSSLHLQTDDQSAVEAAVRKYVPRIGRSGGSVVSAPRNGWIAVYDELCDRDPRARDRLARELAHATGAVVCLLALEEGAVVRYALYDRGQIVDEYLSVPEFFGPLPPGDVVALAANPTVVARLTGADPNAVRAVARTARSPDDLPPAPELLAELARVFGVEGADHGYPEARELPNALVVSYG
jgi:ribosomal protein S18 acetylase RimI-like enzyme